MVLYDLERNNAHVTLLRGKRMALRRECVLLCRRLTKPTRRGGNEEQGNAVNEINVFSSKELSLWHRALFLFSSRLIKKAIPPSPELPHSSGGSHV